jgi:hypothetical protein
MSDEFPLSSPAKDPPVAGRLELGCVLHLWSRPAWQMPAIDWRVYRRGYPQQEYRVVRIVHTFVPEER